MGNFIAFIQNNQSLDILCPNFTTIQLKCKVINCKPTNPRQKCSTYKIINYYLRIKYLRYPTHNSNRFNESEYQTDILGLNTPYTWTFFQCLRINM